MANSTQGGQQAITHQGAFDQSAAKDVQTALTQGDAVVLVGSADAVPFPGLIIINPPSGVDACTLAVPKAGPQPGGDDGKCITIFTNTAAAHTVTTPANGIAPSKHIITFAATIGSTIELQAWNGVWFPTGPGVGATIT